MPRQRGRVRLVDKLWSVSYRFALLAAIVSVPLFVIALIGGLGLKSLLVLGAALFWVVRARQLRGRAQAASRHRELRRRRLERERATHHRPS